VAVSVNVVVGRRGWNMPKFLTRAKLTQEGLQGTLKEGGTARLEAIRQATESLGGRVEALYYAFGEYDLYAIADWPDNVTAAAAAMTVSAAGVATQSTVVLMTPEDMDEVSKKAATSTYTAPGA
jgi:uncharacterized protein with GYD domain